MVVVPFAKIAAGLHKMRHIKGQADAIALHQHVLRVKHELGADVFAELGPELLERGTASANGRSAIAHSHSSKSRGSSSSASSSEGITISSTLRLMETSDPVST